MKFRLISKFGDGIALLHRIWKEGNKVDFWIAKKSAKPTYKGILKQVPEWSKGLTKDTIVIFDMVGMGSLADKLRKEGYKVFGGGGINDSLELNRDFGMKVARISGLLVPKYEKFSRVSEAKKFVTGPCVFKPLNNKSPQNTYVSTDAEDMIEMLDYFGDGDFVIQDKVEGVELSTEGFYINGALVPHSLNSTFEQKRFMDGDKGPNTGCQSSVVRFWQGEPKIYRMTLKKVEPFLKKFKYTGPLDANCIITGPNKAYFLEWTPRFGYSAIYALAEGLNMEMGKFIADMASGRIPRLRPSNDWMGAVRVSIPPYPSDVSAAKSAGRPIRGLNSLKHFWLLDAMSENDKLITAGVDGVVCEVTARARRLDTLEAGLYRRIKGLKIPDMQYRSDAVSGIQKRLSRLKGWKYF